MYKLLSTFLLIYGLSGCDVNAFGTQAGDVSLYWQAPSERANGEDMESSEIGGYEIRYKHVKDDSYNTIVIKGNAQYNFTIIDVPAPENYIFEVAVFDTNGIYSDFVVAR